jgi:curli production assembly/transport component CsgE
MFLYAKQCLVPLLWFTCALAAAAPAASGGGGVVTSQMVTVAGHDFSQYFIAAWRDMDGSEHYTLAVRERPSARWGSEVWVEYAQRRVFHARLPAARAAVGPLSVDAAEAVYQAVQQADLQRKLAGDADLAPDETWIDL